METIITFFKMLLYTVKYFFATALIAILIFWFLGPLFDPLLFIALFTVIYPALGVIIVFVFRRKVFFFPMWKLITGRSPLGQFDDDGALSLKDYIEREVYESRERRDYRKLVKTYSSVVSLTPKGDFSSGYDVPGLSSSVFVNSSVQSGVPGRGNVSPEVKDFARAVSKAGFVEYIPFVWGVQVPELAVIAPDRTVSEAIDVVIPTRDTLYLVKVIESLGQNAIYSLDGDGVIVARDEKSGEDLKVSIKPTDDLAKSVERFSAHFKTLKVVGVVVAIGKNGDSKFEKLVWPGNIKVRVLKDFLEELDFASRQDLSDTEEIVNKLSPVVL